MAWKSTQVRAGHGLEFNELKDEYLRLKSDRKNIETKRQPNEESEHYYSKALELHTEGSISDLMYMAIALNKYRKQLGIRQNNSS